MNVDFSSDVYLAFDLGGKSWELAVWASEMKNPSVYRLRGNTSYDQEPRLEKLERRLEQLLKKYGPGASFQCCYEAGLHGNWLDRWLEARGIDNEVISPSSLEERKDKKKKKTDKLDAKKLVRKLKQYVEGDRRAFSTVRVPTLGEEAIRERQREREKLMKEKHAASRFLECKVSQYGIEMKKRPKGASGWQAFMDHLGEVRTYNGDTIPEEVQGAMRRCVLRLELVEEQFNDVEAEIREYHQSLPEDSAAKKLERHKGIGFRLAQQLCSEIMDWGRFQNRKQPGGFAGLDPTPSISCTKVRELGISKAGNPRLRKSAIELAWLWWRWQPESALTQKYAPDLKKKGRRRKMAIVGLARELLVALWRHVTQGMELEGAIYKAVKK
ncbi:MAG: IS110 family transposase [Planctomycetota bacterium]|nr:IS110 family transposase [Planctomycetota bacterium]